jgi:hypothetical protein
MALWIGTTLVVVAMVFVVACLQAKHLATSASTRFMEDLEQMRAVRLRPQRRASAGRATTTF